MNQTLLYKFLVDKHYRVFRHLLLIVIVSFITLNYALPFDHFEVLGTGVFTIYAFFLLLTYLIPVYFNMYYLMPRYMFTHKYFSYFFVLSLLILCMLASQSILEDTAYEMMGISVEPTYNFNNNYIFILDLLGNYFLTYIAFAGCTATLLLRNWINDNQRAGQLEKEHLQTQVERVKQQVNSGFLFNTLNRIAFIGETNPVEASAVLIKFSKLLRYQLYDSNRNEVFLTSEIQFLTDYLQLEQLYYEKLKFEIRIEGNSSLILVPPILFIPFVRQLIGGIKNRMDHANLLLSFNIQKGDNLIFTCTGDMKADTNGEEFNSIRQRLNVLFGNGYSIEMLPPPFIIPEGHKISLTLKQDEWI
ncbi:sensor histidine kinase [Bacteroides sp. 519]|uniref:sensor histidine kinase n=1 Tax=Bacteroides sp. 519 TaxID=2302937 RepID=UPI0013D801F4|nr:histidine kinase [Bacteroides sp. 519]NDV59612.1 hypothetical protein [Bacteroides sp. 519]